MKKILILLFILFSLTACDKTREDEKIAYLEKKSILNDRKQFTSKEDLPFDYKINIDKNQKDKIDYDIFLYDLKENMNNVKAMAIHNYYSDDLFPTIGLSKEIVDKTMNDNIELKGSIDSEENINKLKFKVWIQYTDNEANLKNIYFIV